MAVATATSALHAVQLDECCSVQTTGVATERTSANGSEGVNDDPRLLS
jgi:hypothetical protein